MRKRLLLAFLISVMYSLPVFCGASPDVLFDQEIKVLRDDFKEVHFLIPENSAEPLQIKGSFKSKGGFNDDLTFYAFTKEEYVKWFSHRTFTALAEFKKKMEGKFQFPAKPGQTYYFVLDNFFSTVSHKTVKLQIELLPLKEQITE